jgi:hypothetical protein
MKRLVISALVFTGGFCLMQSPWRVVLLGVLLLCLGFGAIVADDHHVVRNQTRAVWRASRVYYVLSRMFR